MVAPFPINDVSAVAEQLTEELWKTDSYAEDSWKHPILGPFVHIQALLRYRPEAALGEDFSEEHLARCRVYIWVFSSTLYSRLTGAEPESYDDGFLELMTEYDEMVDVDFIAIHDTAREDAIAHPLGKATKTPLRKPGSVRRTND